MPWYYIKYVYEPADPYSTQYYSSSAYLHPFYIYENVECEGDCQGQPGTLLLEEGFRLWITSPTSVFEMRVIFLISWSFVAANIFLLIYLMIRKTKAKRISYISLMFSVAATFVFMLLPFVFDPCIYPGLTIPTGPCDAFFGDQQLDENRTFSYGPYGAWYTTFIGFILCSIGFLLALLSPTPPKEFEEV